MKPRATLCALLLLTVLMALMATPALAQQAFPFLGVTDQEILVAERGFSMQWALFGGFSGVAGNALYYLSLTCAFVGALLLVFNKAFHKFPIMAAWFILVVIMLFAPYNSRLLFYPLNPTQTDCLPDSTAGGGVSGVSSACGFMPQMLAMHLGNTLHVLFYDLLKSEEMNSYLDCQSGQMKLSRSELARPSGATIPDLDRFNQECEGLQPMPLDMQPADYGDSAGGEVPTWGGMVDAIRESYAGGATSGHPIMALPKTLGDAQGWTDAEWSKYRAGLATLYAQTGAPDRTLTYTVTDSPDANATNNVTVDDAVDAITDFLLDSAGDQISPADAMFFVSPYRNGMDIDPSSAAEVALASRQDNQRCDRADVFNGTTTSNGDCEAASNMVATYDLRDTLFNDPNLADMPVVRINVGQDPQGGLSAEVMATTNCKALGAQVFNNMCLANVTGGNRIESAAEGRPEFCSGLAEGTDVCASGGNNAFAQEMCGLVSSCDGGGNQAFVYTITETARLAALTNNTSGGGVGGAGNGFTPETIGFLGGFGPAQWIVNFASETVAQIGSLFSGVLAMGTIHILQILMRMALMSIPIITPIFFLMGLLIPGNAPGLLFLSVMSIMVLKIVPVTWLVIDFLSTIISQELVGLDDSTANALLLFAVAGLYLSSIGLTLFIMFKIGDPGNLARIASLDNSAKEAAQAGVRVATALGAIAAMAVGGAALGAVGTAWAGTKAGGAAGAAGRNLLRRAASAADPSGTASAAMGGAGGGGNNPSTPVENMGKDGTIPPTGGENPLDAASSTVERELEQETLSNSIGNAIDSNTLSENMREMRVGESVTLPGNDGQDYLLNKGEDGSFGIRSVSQLNEQMQHMQAADGASLTGETATIANATGAAAAPGELPNDGFFRVRVDGGQLDAIGTIGQAQQGAATEQGNVPPVEGDQNADVGQQSATVGNQTVINGGAPEAPVEVPNGLTPAALEARENIHKELKSAIQRNGGGVTPETKDKIISDNMSKLSYAEQMAARSLDIENPHAMREIAEKMGLKGAKFEAMALDFKKDDKGNLINPALKELQAINMQDPILKSATTSLRAAEAMDRVLQSGTGDPLSSRGRAVRAGYGALSGFVGGLGAGGGLRSIPIVGGILEEWLNETTQAGERARGWAARGGGTNAGSMARGFLQRQFVDPNRVARGRHWAQEASSMSASDQFNAMDTLGNRQAQVNLAKQAANEAAQQVKSQFDALTAKTIGMRGGIDANMKLEDFNIANATFNLDDLQGLGTMGAARRLESVFVESAIYKHGIPIGIDANGKEAYAKIGSTMALEMANATAVKAQSSDLDGLLAQHYKAREKHMREAYRAGGGGDPVGTVDMSRSQASVAKYLRKDIDTDYAAGALIDIVKKKEAFMNMRGQYGALKVLRMQDIAQKDDMPKVLGEQFDKMMATRSEDVQAYFKQAGMKFELDPKMMDKNRQAFVKSASKLEGNQQQLALGGMHALATKRGYMQEMSKSRFVKEEITALVSDNYERELKLMTRSMGGIVEPRFQQARKYQGTDGMRAGLNGWHSELNSSLAEMYGQKDYIEKQRKLLDIMNSFTASKNGGKADINLVIDYDYNKEQKYSKAGFKKDFIEHLQKVAGKEFEGYLNAMDNNDGAFARSAAQYAKGKPLAGGLNDNDSGLVIYALDAVKKKRNP